MHGVAWLEDAPDVEKTLASNDSSVYSSYHYRMIIISML